MPNIAGGSLYINKPLIVFYGDRHVPDSGAYDAEECAYRNDLTVSSVLKNSAGSTVSGSSTTCTLVPFTSGDRQGIYEGVQSGEITLTENADYYLEITVLDGLSRVDFVRIHYTAKYKGASG